jgi:hypothetical protein
LKNNLILEIPLTAVQQVLARGDWSRLLLLKAQMFLTSSSPASLQNETLKQITGSDARTFDASCRASRFVFGPQSMYSHTPTTC